MPVTPLEPHFVERVQYALSQVSNLDVGPVTSERPLKDLGLDSVTMAELLIVLEESMEISLEQTDIEQLRTFGDLQDVVHRLRSTHSM
jgi:acyl carrier protein